MVDGMRVVSMLGAGAALTVGIIHVWLSFAEASVSLSWSNGSWIEEINDTWQHAFELTPDAIVEHWQALIIGIIAFGQHSEAMRVRAFYATWFQMCLFYVFVAFFGCFGYAGNIGIIAGALCLVSAAISLGMALGRPSSAPLW